MSIGEEKQHPELDKDSMTHLLTKEAGHASHKPDVADSPLPVKMTRLQADAAASSRASRPFPSAILHRTEQHLHRIESHTSSCNFR